MEAGKSTSGDNKDVETIKVNNSNLETLYKIKDELPTVSLPDIVNDYIQTTLKPIHKYTHYTIAESKKIGNILVIMINLTSPEKIKVDDYTRVYICVDDKIIQHFTNSEAFLRFIASKELSPDLITRLFRFEVISGSLAFILLFAVIISALVQSGHVDPVLGSALSLVIGFYFGRETKA